MSLFLKWSVAILTLDLIQLTEELQAVFVVDSVPCLRTVQLWIGAIKDCSFSFRKNVISGRPRSVWVPEITIKVENVVAKCPRISMRELARILNTDYTSIHRILTKDLQMQKLCSVWVPTVLSEKNKKDRIICCKRILKDVSVSKSPYSPDLNLCDRFLLTRLQEHCRAK